MPIEKTVDASYGAVNKLLKQCRAIRFSPKQLTTWQGKVAWDLNYLMGRAEYFLNASGNESDVAAAEATLRIVARAAEFEGIRRAK